MRLEKHMQNNNKETAREKSYLKIINNTVKLSEKILKLKKKEYIYSFEVREG